MPPWRLIFLTVKDTQRIVTFDSILPARKLTVWQSKREDNRYTQDYCSGSTVVAYFNNAKRIHESLTLNALETMIRWKRASKMIVWYVHEKPIWIKLNYIKPTHVIETYDMSTVPNKFSPRCKGGLRGQYTSMVENISNKEHRPISGKRTGRHTLFM